MIDATLNPEELERLHRGALVDRMPAAVCSISGPGALQCLQGLLTNDLVKPGDGSLVYGALLTPKGLIVLDCWTIRLGERIIFISDFDARSTALELFRKQLPPRLARVTDLSDERQVLRVFGGGAKDALAKSGLGQPPGAGRASALVLESGELVIAQGTTAAPFAALVAGPATACVHARDALAKAGARTGTPHAWEAARILAGWARRGAEIDEKTLVQEVRFDENGGVSYEKGCYTGQETVARLHFRGHTNRDLRGIAWATTEPLSDTKIVAGEKEVGSVRSVLTLPTGRIGLALIRREVETGQLVTAGGLPATVVALPFEA